MRTVSIEPEIDAGARFLESLVANSPGLDRVAFRFWDGTIWPDSKPRDAMFVLQHPGALREMFGAGTEKALVESFLRDDFEIEGDIEAACHYAEKLQWQNGEGWLAALRNGFHLRRLPSARRRDHEDSARPFATGRSAKHSLDRDRRAVSFHYDVSNEFYRLWLDREMLYSCAYFERADAALDEAQEAKLRHLCRKLRLQPGQRLLDIGCGWGGLAIYAAQNYYVHVTGITLSQRQAERALARVQAAGLTERVKIVLQDYRELDPAEPFDAIVSVGMAEHVGANQLPRYFETAARLLKVGGVFLNHAIGDGIRPRSFLGPSFMEEYVFPDSETPPIPAVLKSAEDAGFEVRDVENLREHYALTLRHWVRRLEATHTKALAFVDEATFRLWRLYMAGSAHGFARGHLAIYQTLLAKLDESGRSHLPLTRRDWYA